MKGITKQTGLLVFPWILSPRGDHCPDRRPVTSPAAGPWRNGTLTVCASSGRFPELKAQCAEGRTVVSRGGRPAMWGEQHGTGAEGAEGQGVPPPLGWRWPRCWQEPGCPRRQGAGRPRPAGRRSKEQRGTESLPSAVLISSFQRLTLPRLTPPSVRTPRPRWGCR